MIQHEAEFPSKKDLVSLPLFIKESISKLHPVYFAMVMATGIISINFELLGLSQAAILLFIINIIIYSSLSLMFLGRIFLFTSEFIKDCSDHQRSPGFFTLVAANSVLGVQCYLIAGSPQMAKIFFGLAVFFWVITIYSIFVLLTVKRNKPAFDEGINGGWLVSIVATQSIPVAGLIFLNPAENNETMLFILTSFWMCGGMLYVWIISIIFYRYMFFRFDPNDLMPPYWVNMGAMAISALAGSLLLMKTEGSALLTPLLPFITGLTLMSWATATWWIPMLLVLGIWRHGIRKVRITYSPLYWGLVFPLGMYSVSTIRLTQILAVPEWLILVSKIFAVFAISAWALAFLGMFTRVLHAISLALHADSTEVKFLRGSQMKIVIAENKIKRGKKMVIYGLVLIITGIILYCINGFIFGIQTEISEYFTNKSSLIFYVSLTCILGGTILWITGLMKYLNGIMEQYQNEG